MREPRESKATGVSKKLSRIINNKTLEPRKRKRKKKEKERRIRAEVK